MHYVNTPKSETTATVAVILKTTRRASAYARTATEVSSLFPKGLPGKDLKLTVRQWLGQKRLHDGYRLLS